MPADIVPIFDLGFEVAGQALGEVSSHRGLGQRNAQSISGHILTMPGSQARRKCRVWRWRVAIRLALRAEFYSRERS